MGVPLNSGVESGRKLDFGGEIATIGYRSWLCAAGDFLFLGGEMDKLEEAA